MARLETWYKQDLKRPLVVHKHTDVFNQDSKGNLIGVEVYSDGEPVVLSGSISGYCLLADGTTVPAVGASRSGNKASVLIPQTAYSVPGPITITIKNVEGDNITTLCATVGVVRQSVSGNIVNPGSVVTDWSNNINAQLQAVQTAADNVGAIVAAPFDESTVYVVGNYVTNNGNLYRVTADHASGVEWADTAKVQCTVGHELEALNNHFVADWNLIDPDAASGNETDFLPVELNIRYNIIHAQSKGQFHYGLSLYDSNKTMLYISQLVDEATDGTNYFYSCTFSQSAIAYVKLKINSAPSGIDTTDFSKVYFGKGSEYIEFDDYNVIDLINDVSDLKSALGTVPSGKTAQGQIDDNANDISDLKSAITVSEYSSESTYSAGDLVFRNSVLYRAKVDISTPEAWTSGHWQATSLEAEIDSVKAMLVSEYSSESTYSAGDYVYHLSKIYKARFDIPTPEAWTSGHWRAIPTDAMNELHSNENAIMEEIDSINDAIAEIVTPPVDVSVINLSSFDMKIERYEHMAYSQKMFTNETFSRYSSPLVEKDYSIKFQHNPYSIHYKTNTTDESTEFRINVPTFTLLGTQEFEVVVYIPDATNITGFSFRTLESRMVKSNDVTPVTGWNKFRFYTEGAGAWIEDTDTTTLRFLTYHSAGTNVDLYIGSIVQIKPDKACLIMEDDGPYYTFYNVAYPAFKQINVPVTWALDPMLLDSNDEINRKLINMDELELLAHDGISEFSFHNYDGTIMSKANAQQALSDTLNCVRFLKENGLAPEHIFRAAWLQNACGDPSLANLEVEASATYTGRSGLVNYPFARPYDIARYGIGGRTVTVIDGIFEKLRKQHCCIFVYCHGISEADRDTTQSLLNYFISKVNDAITAGYLMPTTYNRLVNYFKPLK